MKNTFTIVLVIIPLLLTACTRSENTASLVSITITPSSPVIAAGTTQQFFATGLYSDNTSRDLTASATWSSSDGTKATISNSEGSYGLAASVDGGSTQITAALGSITADTTLTINKLVFSHTAFIQADDVNAIKSVNFIVHTKPGNKSKDINVTYSLSYLKGQGFVHETDETVEVPIFGLYAGYLNAVDLTVNWNNTTATTTSLNIQTDAFVSNYKFTGITVYKTYENPTVSFMIIDTLAASPVILDIDGEIRWQNYVNENYRAYLDDIGPIGGFLLFDSHGTGIRKTNFKGEVIESNTVSDGRYYGFHHNIELGKQGLLATVNYNNGVVDQPLAALIEVSPQGEIFESWDFNEIIGDKIREAGEDPSNLVLYGLDWFHMNSAIYSPSDDSVIVSSRENFVIKVDYSTKKIKWILGNVGKLWYQNYPLSLQPLALSVSGKAPIGQHALSLTTDANHLLLFDNGYGNEILPSVGDTRSYSAISLYEINESQMTADEVFTYDAGEKFYSPVCSSVYKTGSGEYLINFSSVSEVMDAARIMIIDGNKNVNVDMVIPKRSIDIYSCETVYRVKEIKLESLHFD